MVQMILLRKMSDFLLLLLNKIRDLFLFFPDISVQASLCVVLSIFIFS